MGHSYFLDANKSCRRAEEAARLEIVEADWPIKDLSGVVVCR